MRLFDMQLYVLVLLPLFTHGQLFDDLIFEDGDFFLGMAGMVGGNTETPSLTATPSTVTVTPSTASDTASPTASSTVTMSSTVAPTGECPALTTPTNGAITLTCTENGIQCSATFECDEGYTLSGQTTLLCRASQGTWNAVEPTCSRISCGFPTIPHGVYSGNIFYGDTGTVTCDTGYALNGSPPMQCSANGWVNVPECVFDDCGTLSNPDNGVVSYDCSKVGCTANYTCNTGFEPFSNASFACIKDFGWEITPICVEQASQKTVSGSGSFGSYEGAYDQNYKQEVQKELLAYFKNEVGDGVKDVVITGLDETTGEFNFTIIAEDDTDVDNGLSVAMSAFVQGATIPLYGQDFGMDKVSLEGVSVNLNSTDDTEACKVYESLSKNSCAANTQCQIKDKKVVCTPIQEKETDGLRLGVILALAIGLPLTALIFIGIVICCRFCCVPKRRRRFSDTDSDDSSRPYISPWAIPRPTVLIPTMFSPKGPSMPRSFYSDAGSTVSQSSNDSDEQSYTNFSGGNLFHPNWKW